MASCTRHFLGFHWDHHEWRRQVSADEHLPTHDTNMWGRMVYGDYVRCFKQYVCERCGQTRGEVSCLCDTAHADQCAIRLAYLDRARR